MQKLFRCVVLAALVAALPLPASAGDLKITLANGRATIIATDVPLRQILTEWARIGKTTIVNADKLVGPTVTLQLVDVPEAQALDTLLRSASGYVVAQRAEALPDASRFDRIMIMPTSRPPATSAAPPATFNQPARPMPQPVPDDDEPADAPVVVPPGMNAQPQPMNTPGMQPMATPAMPGTQPNGQPMTAPRPGMLPAPPAGQPNPYGTTPGVIRPPGGPGGGPGGGGDDR
ncbi:MAG TPA: hypothetical protein VF147_12805 [Vicinamibacterales bacterium]